MAKRYDTPERIALKAVLTAVIGHDAGAGWYWCRLCSKCWGIKSAEFHNKRCPIPRVRKVLAE